MNCIPIINENDVVASPPGMDLDLAGVSTIKFLFQFMVLTWGQH